MFDRYISKDNWLVKLLAGAAFGASAFFYLSGGSFVENLGLTLDGETKFQLAQVVSITECSDGIDNDGDGLTDWVYDLGCYNAGDTTERALGRDAEHGWTTHDPSVDTRIVYVSNSEGNDAWTGLCGTVPSNGTCGPKKTIAAGFALLRTGYPDWLLLRRGDTWRNEYFGSGNVWLTNPRGRSATERLIIASYGSAKNRPILEQNDSQNIWGVINAAVHDFELYNYGNDVNNPAFNGVSAAGFRLLYANENLLIENNHLRGAMFSVQSIDPSYFKNIEIRRNIIEKNYSVFSHAQGMFSSTGKPNDFLVEENVWDKNGWSDDFRIVLTNPNGDIAQWKTITDGRFDIKLKGTVYRINSLNFTGANSMDDVATLIESRINTAVGQSNAVAFDWTPIGKVFVLKSTYFTDSPLYDIATSTGSVAGTDLNGFSWLNAAKLGVPDSTVFNRNLYLAYGYGITTVRGNIDANGASGGTQLRMGGLAENNLFLRNPIALSIGHGENPAGSVTGGIVRNNVILGGRDIASQPQGTGIAIGGTEIANLSVYGNIIAHNVLGTGNIGGITLGAGNKMTNVEVNNNIVYDWGRPIWPNPNDTRAYGLSVNIPLDSTNISVHHNVVQQTSGGFVGFTTTPENLKAQGVLRDNTYFSTSPNPPLLWSSGWFDIGGAIAHSVWVEKTGDNSALSQVSYPDPSRTIESYMASLGQTATYEAFITEAKKRSRFNDTQAYTAQSVINYIRAGFSMEPISTIATSTNPVPPISGVCGSSNGQTFTSAPTTNLCSAGTPTAVSGSGPWTWQCLGSNGGTDASCSAQLSPTTPTTYTLTVTQPIGGTIISLPSGITCGTDCTEPFTSGTSVTLTAIPATGYAFSTWGGSCTGTQTTCVVTMDQTRSVSAGFAQVTVTFALNDRIRVIEPVRVRETPGLSGKLYGVRSIGDMGTITAGPVSADGYMWWKINFDKGKDGWVAQNYITK